MEKTLEVLVLVVAMIVVNASLARKYHPVPVWLSAVSGILAVIAMAVAGAPTGAAAAVGLLINVLLAEVGDYMIHR